VIGKLQLIIINCDFVPVLEVTGNLIPDRFRFSYFITL